MSQSRPRWACLKICILFIFSVILVAMVVLVPDDDFSYKIHFRAATLRRQNFFNCVGSRESLLLCWKQRFLTFWSETKFLYYCVRGRDPSSLCRKQRFFTICVGSRDSFLFRKRSSLLLCREKNRFFNTVLETEILYHVLKTWILYYWVASRDHLPFIYFSMVSAVEIFFVVRHKAGTRPGTRSLLLSLKNCNWHSHARVHARVFRSGNYWNIINCRARVLYTVPAHGSSTGFRHTVSAHGSGTRFRHRLEQTVPAQVGASCRHKASTREPGASCRG